MYVRLKCKKAAILAYRNVFTVRGAMFATGNKGKDLPSYVDPVNVSCIILILPRNEVQPEGEREQL